MKGISAVALTKQQLAAMLTHSRQPLTTEELESVRALQHYAEEKCYRNYTSDQVDYLEFLLKGSPKYHLLQARVQSMTSEKETILEGELQKEILRFEGRRKVTHEPVEQQNKNKEAEILRQKTELVRRHLLGLQNIEGNPESVDSEYQKKLSTLDIKQLQLERQREVREFLKLKQKEKDQRHRKLRQLREQQRKQQQFKQEVEKKQEQKLQEQRKQELLNKSHKIQQKLQSQRSTRQKHEEKYAQQRRLSGEQLPLFKKFEHETTTIIKEKQQQLRQKLQSRRQKLNLSPLDFDKMEEHARRYAEYLQQQERKRQERIRMKMEELNDREKFYSNYKEEQKEPDPSPEELKQPLIEKRERIKRYESLIKEQFKPKIDEAKRKQLLNFIEELHLGSRKLKKIKLENGSVLYEQMPQTDPKQIGIKYLEFAKEMSEKGRSVKRYAESPHASTRPHKIDYLEQVKKQNHQHKQQRQHNFSQQLKKYDYDERLKRVQQKSDVIDEQARRKEVLLKYGKFMTAEEILKCKQQLDDHYLEVINMKLKLISESEAA